MKNLFIAAVAVMLFTACKDGKNGNNADGDLIEPTPVDTTSAMGTTSRTEEAVFVCPMHPEVIGSQGEKCPKCGMDLAPKDPTPAGK
jgi:hypothetical protein